jgi:hypothetical protein
MDDYAEQVTENYVDQAIARMRSPQEMVIICVDVTNKCDLHCTSSIASGSRRPPICSQKTAAPLRAQTRALPRSRTSKNLKFRLGRQAEDRV